MDRRDSARHTGREIAPGSEEPTVTDDDDDAAQLEGDRQTVAALAAEGDLLTKPRQVDHWAYFPIAEARDQFIDEVVTLGFSASDIDDGGSAPDRFCACVSRVDPVDLESIHCVVMILFRAAKRHAGEYDGAPCAKHAQQPRACGGDRMAREARGRGDCSRRRASACPGRDTIGGSGRPAAGSVAARRVATFTSPALSWP